MDAIDVGSWYHVGVDGSRPITSLFAILCTVMFDLVVFVTDLYKKYLICLG